MKMQKIKVTVETEVPVGNLCIKFKGEPPTGGCRWLSIVAMMNTCCLFDEHLHNGKPGVKKCQTCLDAREAWNEA